MLKPKQNLRILLAAIPTVKESMKLASIESDKGKLEFDGEVIEVGTAVYITDSEGTFTAAPDGDYIAEGQVYTVVDGIVTAIADSATPVGLEDAPAPAPTEEVVTGVEDAILRAVEQVMQTVEEEMNVLREENVSLRSDLESLKTELKNAVKLSKQDLIPNTPMSGKVVNSLSPQDSFMRGLSK